MNRFPQMVAVLLVVAFTSACALSLRNPQISELKNNPGRYQNHSVNIDGVVTTSWGVPFAPFHLYKVDDGTGEVTVLSQSSRPLSRGARVSVKGRVDEIAVLGGQAVGLHLREERLRVKR